MNRLYKFDEEEKDFHHDVVEHEPMVVNTVFTTEKYNYDKSTDLIKIGDIEYVRKYRRDGRLNGYQRII